MFWKIASIQMCNKQKVACPLLPKDRLAAYYHWNSERTLEKALWIAEKNSFDMDNMKQWSQKEGMNDKFEIFMGKYEDMVASRHRLLPALENHGRSKKECDV